jgi:DNA-binding response OmpR family regulator
VILDVMLPKVNGFEVLQTVRKEGHTMPIIMLSARTGEMDKVTGLELGAEDYVAKPFSLAELLARVRAALRRAVPPPAAVTYGTVRIDPAARSVHKGGALVDITATEFDVLMCLVRAKGRVLTRDEIFRKVWGPNHHGTPRTIDNFMQQIRAKLEDDPSDPKHFHTVRGVGYRFDP